MRLETIDLIRFGHFRRLRIGLPARQPDYHVIYGDNEVGKSTLLRAISALFFGVPAKTPDVHGSKGSELRIGATISDASGRVPALKDSTPALFGDTDDGGHSKKQFSFRRRKGMSGTLLNLSEGQIPEDSLAPFLRELDRERFEQFFGLNHDRLRQGGQELLQGKGDVGSALFQAAGLLDLRRLQERLASDAKEIFSPRSRTKTIGRILGEYREAKGEISRLAISGPTVRQKQAELEAAEKALESLKAEHALLQQALDRLRRIRSNKPDLARLQVVRSALAALETVLTLPADARRQFNEATSTLATATSQINTLTHDIGQREKRIKELPADSSFTTHESEIEDLNTGTSAYSQSVADRGKRLREQEEAIQQAQSAWKQVWLQAVTEAENLKNTYAHKEEILKLVAEHRGLTSELTNAEEELRNVTQDQWRLEEQLAQHPEVADPAGLVAAIEHAKSLGDTESANARLQRETERLTRNLQRQMQNLALWSGSIQELENLKTPLVATIDQYGREWESTAAARQELSLRRGNVLEVIRQKEGELGSLTSQISGAGEGEMASVRARRDEMWQLIRAATFDKKMPQAEAEKRSGSSVPLADAFTIQLHKADQIADVRFAHARDVAIHDRLVKGLPHRGASSKGSRKKSNGWRQPNAS